MKHFLPFLGMEVVTATGRGTSCWQGLQTTDVWCGRQISNGLKINNTFKILNISGDMKIFISLIHVVFKKNDLYTIHWNFDGGIQIHTSHNLVVELHTLIFDFRNIAY